MANCIIHVDGSSYSQSKKKTYTGLGWAIVAEHNNQTHEACGALTVKKIQGLNGAHEDIALLRALEYMRSNGFHPQNTSIYCDDDLLGHAPTYLAKENYLGFKAEKVAERVNKAAKCIGQTHLVDLILQELAQVKMHKVKGHQGHVYQERVDYLAKWSAHLVLGESQEKLTFEHWLRKGLVIYGPPETTPTAPALPTGEEEAPTLEGPSLVDLGLEDPSAEGAPTPPVYKPSVRNQYAPFARTLDDEPPEPSGPTP